MPQQQRVLHCIPAFKGWEGIPVEEFSGLQKPVWSIIDRPWHCIDRARYLCENGLLSTPRKSLSHVRLNLLKLHILGEWANETSAPVLKSMLLEPIPALGFLLGPRDYIASTRPCLCACLSPSVCMCVYFWLCSTKLVCVHCYSYDLLRAESKAEWEIRVLKASLGTSGCDWQEKKGSLCSENWQQKPDPTQYNPAQYSTEPANMGEKNTNSRTVSFHPSLLIPTLGQFS